MQVCSTLRIELIRIPAGGGLQGVGVGGTLLMIVRRVDVDQPMLTKREALQQLGAILTECGVLIRRRRRRNRLERD